MSARCPYYQYVPKDRAANLNWRLAVCRRAMVDAEFREGIRQMCAEDPLFFINGFCWVFEPRKDKLRKNRPKVMPFILWPHQERNALEMIERWGTDDMVVVKSRGEGFSWLVLMLGLHSWLFEEGFVMGLISKDEKSCFKKGDMNALMPKLDWALAKGRLPEWLRPRFEGTTGDMKLLNLDNGSIFNGYAATGDAASGGRTTVFLKDERAKFPRQNDQELEDSLQHVTNCQIDGSTPKGDIGVFADKSRGGLVHRIDFDWRDNPTKNRGLYAVRDGEIVELDRNNPLRPGYRQEMRDIHRRLEAVGFVIEGTTRSEWFDNECLRSGKPLSIAQELERQFGKSEERPFDRNEIDKLVIRYAKSPNLLGNVRPKPDSTELKFTQTSGGMCKLWTPLGADPEWGLRPPKRAFGAGADVSFGTGGDSSSNSVLIVGDLYTGEQVFEFVSFTTMIPEFAKLAAWVCRWFWNATLNWDSNGGAGGMFTRHIVEHQKYWNIHYTIGADDEKKAGTYRHDEESKAVYLDDAVNDMRCGTFIPRSEQTIREFGQFGFKGGKIVHLRAERTMAEGAKNKAHGDSATAAAMFNIVRRALEGTAEPTQERPPDEHGPLQRVGWACPANRILDNNEKTGIHRLTGPYANRPRPVRP